MIERVRYDTILVNGVRSPLLECGEASAEAVVFAHGIPGSSRDWRDLAARTGRFARAVSWDMPGFGRADKPEDFDHTVAGHARHFDAALAALGIERAHLVLHDFGGGPGLAWAAAHPDRCASITLVATGITPASGSSAMRIRRIPPLADLLETLGSRTAFELAMRAHGRLPRAWLDRMYADWDRETRRAVVAIQKAMQAPPPARPMARIISAAGVPVLVVWGRADRVTPVTLGTAQKRFFPEARIEILEQSGHWPFADDPDGVARLIVPFIELHAGDAFAVT